MPSSKRPKRCWGKSWVGLIPERTLLFPSTCRPTPSHSAVPTDYTRTPPSSSSESCGLRPLLDLPMCILPRLIVRIAQSRSNWEVGAFTLATALHLRQMYGHRMRNTTRPSRAAPSSRVPQASPQNPCPRLDDHRPRSLLLAVVQGPTPLGEGFPPLSLSGRGPRTRRDTWLLSKLRPDNSSHGPSTTVSGQCRVAPGGNWPWEPPNPVTVESRANARLRETDDPLLPAKELRARDLAERLLDTIDGCLQLRDTEWHGRIGCDA